MFLAGARSFCHKDREPSISLIAAQACFRICIISETETVTETLDSEITQKGNESLLLLLCNLATKKAYKML